MKNFRKDWKFVTSFAFLPWQKVWRHYANVPVFACLATGKVGVVRIKKITWLLGALETRFLYYSWSHSTVVLVLHFSFISE